MRGRWLLTTVGQWAVELSTTKTHVGNLLTKLAARDRVQLTITAYEAGLMRT